MGEKLPKKAYENELYRLQAELVKMQNWARASGARIVVVFEGRDAAGKGGTISRVTQYLNPRFARLAALDKPTEREKAQWTSSGMRGSSRGSTTRRAVIPRTPGRGDPGAARPKVANSG
jgi:hypothetical protein